MFHLILLMGLVSTLPSTHYAVSIKPIEKSVPLISIKTPYLYWDPSWLAAKTYEGIGNAGILMPVTIQAKHHLWLHSKIKSYSVSGGYRYALSKCHLNQYWFGGGYLSYDQFPHQEASNRHRLTVGGEIGGAQFGQLTVNGYALLNHKKDLAIAIDQGDILTLFRKLDTGLSVHWLSTTTTLGCQVKLLGTYSKAQRFAQNVYDKETIWRVGAGLQIEILEWLHGSVQYFWIDPYNEGLNIGVTVSSVSIYDRKDRFQGRLSRPPIHHLPEYELRDTETPKRPVTPQNPAVEEVFDCGDDQSATLCSGASSPSPSRGGSPNMQPMFFKPQENFTRGDNDRSSRQPEAPTVNTTLQKTATSDYILPTASNVNPTPISESSTDAKNHFSMSGKASTVSSSDLSVAPEINTPTRRGRAYHVAPEKLLGTTTVLNEPVNSPINNTQDTLPTPQKANTFPKETPIVLSTPNAKTEDPSPVSNRQSSSYVGPSPINNSSNVDRNCSVSLAGGGSSKNDDTCLKQPEMLKVDGASEKPETPNYVFPTASEVNSIPGCQPSAATTKNCSGGGNTSRVSDVLNTSPKIKSPKKDGRYHVAPEKLSGTTTVLNEPVNPPINNTQGTLPTPQKANTFPKETPKVLSTPNAKTEDQSPFLLGRRADGNSTVYRGTSDSNRGDVGKKFSLDPNNDRSPIAQKTKGDPTSDAANNPKSSRSTSPARTSASDAKDSRRRKSFVPSFSHGETQDKKTPAQSGNDSEAPEKIEVLEDSSSQGKRSDHATHKKRPHTRDSGHSNKGRGHFRNNPNQADSWPRSVHLALKDGKNTFLNNNTWYSIYHVAGDQTEKYYGVGQTVKKHVVTIGLQGILNLQYAIPQYTDNEGVFFYKASHAKYLPFFASTTTYASYGMPPQPSYGAYTYTDPRYNQYYAHGTGSYNQGVPPQYDQYTYGVPPFGTHVPNNNHQEQPAYPQETPPDPKQTLLSILNAHALDATGVKEIVGKDINEVTLEDFESVRKRVLLKLHPDKLKGNDEVCAKFNTAYEEYKKSLSPSNEGPE